MPLKGALQDFSLPDLFQLIHFGKKNGTLVIANGDAMGYVCFRNGNVFFATHNWKKAPLGQRLIEAGMVSQEQIDEALKLQQTTHKGQRVGNILVELRYLSRESLEVFVEEQIRDAVFNLLRWKEGDFDFDPDQIFPEEDIGLSMRTEDLIMEGSRRLDEWFKIEKKVPSLDSVFRVTEAAGKDAGGLDLTSEERLVFNHVDGESSVRDIIARSGQSALVTCRALYGLVTAGQVVLIGEAAPAGSAVSESSAEDESPAESAVSVVLEDEAAGEPQVPAEEEEEEEEISFGGGSDDDLVIEESGREPRKRSGRSRRKKKKPEEEVLLEDGADAEFVVVVEQDAAEQEAVGQEPVAQEAVEQELEPAPAPEAALTEEEPAEAESETEAADGVEPGDVLLSDGGPEPDGEVSIETAESEAAPQEAAAAGGAPAPGQSLVDYYKAMALKELGDSEIYRETQDRKAFIEKAEKGGLEQEDLREFDVRGAVVEEEESAADMVEPEDIPMEWAGHLTRLRGRTAKPARGKEPVEPEAQEHPPAEEEEASELYAEAAVEDTVVVEEEQEPAPEPVFEIEQEPAPEPVFEIEQEPAPEPVFEIEPELLEGVTELPTVEEAAAFDETAVPTEDDIEKMLQVTPTSRGELSREELLAFDQPTYPILETREGPPAPVEEQFAADGAAEGAGVTERESPAPVAFDEPGEPAGAPGKVIQFSRASAERDSEVVLEQPEPVVRSTAVETLAVAEDLQVAVLETAVESEELSAELEPVAEAEEAERPEALLELVQAIEEAPPLVEEAAAAPDEASEERETAAGYEAASGETEFVLEVEGLEGPAADAVSLDSTAPRAARELELDLELETTDGLEATAQLGQVAGLEAVAEMDAGAELEGAESAVQRAAEEEFAAPGGEQFEDAGEDVIIAGSAAPGQEVASWGEQEPAASDAAAEALVDEAPAGPAVELEAEPGEALEPGLDFDHLEELREIAALSRKEQLAGETGSIIDEAELEAAATDLEPELDYEEEEDAGLLGPMKVSGRRDAGTCLIDLETFELEQELLELAGGSQPKKQKIAIEKTQAEPEAGRKDKKTRGTGRSGGKEVDKGSVKKIIDDLKDK